MKEVSSLPRCYSFSFDIDTVTLFLKIQKWAIPELQRYLKADNLLMKYLKITHNGDKAFFDNFGKIGQNFGFEESICFSKETDDEIIYSYRLNSVFKITDQTCKDCEGTGKAYSNGKCFVCRGTGKQHVQSQKHFSTCLLSLWPIIRFANNALHSQCMEDNVSDWQPNTEKKQMVAVEWSDTSGMCNCSITAWVDESVLHIIEKISDNEVQSIIQAMHKTEETLLAVKTNEKYFRFNHYTEDTFGFKVPGNACTLALEPCGVGMFGGIGKTLSHHNVDTRFQQIEFIVGLSVLSDLTEKYI